MVHSFRLRALAAIVAVSTVIGCSGSVRHDGPEGDGDEALSGVADDDLPQVGTDSDLPQVGEGSNPPQDLFACGDGACDPGEACDTCAQDCGACPCDHDTCTTGGPLEESCDPCVAQVCAVDAFCCDSAWDSICRVEVGTVCGTPCATTCGDALCEAGEDCSSCSQDCGACPVCGDGACDWTEDCSSCSQDCGACPACGDGACQPGETCSTCTQDCGACVCHDVCVTGDPLDASCGTCEAQICAVDSFCCTAMWDSICVAEVGTVCGTPCPASCGNGSCEAGEDCNTCSQDCGACPVCGDGACDWTEDCSSCSQDCGACPVCGDGACDWTEDCSSCSQDCGPCPFCGDGTCGWDESCTTCAGDCGACPACPASALGSTVPQTVTGSTAGLANALAPSCAGGQAPEFTYSFTAPADGSYEFNTFGSLYDTALSVLDGSCQGAALACNDDNQGLQSKVVVQLTAGQTVIVVVDGFSGSSGAFTLNIL